MSGPVDINVSEGPTIGVRQLVWCYAYDGPILGMKIIVTPMDLPALSGDNVREAETAP